jgi:beta-glucosidase
MMVLAFFDGNGRSPFSWLHGKHVPAAHRVRLRVELLEDRQVLSPLSNPAVLPVPGDYPYWAWRESQIVSNPRGNPDVVFLGDSITDAFATTVGAPVWDAAMAPLKADNFAIGGSTTQTVQWQVDHDGILNGIAPEMVVLMIGTNNLAEGEAPEQTAEGIAATVGAIQAKEPEAEVLLLGILPRGASADNPMRGLVAQTNELIAPLGNLSHVTYLDIGGAFLQGDGSISPAIMADYLHPTLLGYERLTVALAPSLDQWLQSPVPSHPDAEIPSTAGNAVAATSTLAVQPLARNAASTAVITAVMPRLETSPVPWPAVTVAPWAAGPAIRNEAPITVGARNLGVEDTRLVGPAPGERTDSGDWVGWTDDVWATV